VDVAVTGMASTAVSAKEKAARRVACGVIKLALDFINCSPFYNCLSLGKGDARQPELVRPENIFWSLTRHHINGAAGFGSGLQKRSSRH
jgi:hypothetical protein